MGCNTSKSDQVTFVDGDGFTITYRAEKGKLLKAVDGEAPVLVNKLEINSCPNDQQHLLRSLAQKCGVEMPPSSTSNLVIAFDDVVEALRKKKVSEADTSGIVAILKDKAFTYTAPKLTKQKTDLEKKASERGEKIRIPLWRIFLQCDADNTGFATKDELADVLERYIEIAPTWGFPSILDKLDRATVDTFFDEADVNKDDKLSWDEFFNHIQDMIKLQTIKEERAMSRVLSARALSTDDFESMQMGATRSRKSHLSEWQVDYWGFAGNNDFEFVVFAFTQLKCLNVPDMAFNLNRFGVFFNKIKSAYNDVPYHSFLHALATFHYSFKLVEVSGLYNKVKAPDLVGMLLAALCHDVDHRGHNTMFEVVTRSELAMRYNDKSPLENHHSARSFAIAVESPEGNIFKDWSQEKYTHVRQRMVGIILATDMAFHGDHVKHLSNLTEVSDDIGFLLELFVHAADLGNAIMPAGPSAKWSQAIQEEFTAQVAEERRLGIPVSAFMDGLDNPVKAIKSQLGFIDFVATPLFNPLFELFPSLGEPQGNLTKNRERLQLELRGNSTNSLGK